MSASTIKLLEAAAEIVGGNAALAARLGIRETLLARLMSDGRLPDALLLRAVDILLAHRQPPGCAGEGPAQFARGWMND